MLKRANRRIGAASLTAFTHAKHGGATVIDHGDRRQSVTVRPPSAFAFIEATRDRDWDGSLRFNPLPITLENLFREFEEDPTVCEAIDYLTTAENRSGSLSKVTEIVTFEIGSRKRNPMTVYRD